MAPASESRLAGKEAVEFGFGFGLPLLLDVVLTPGRFNYTFIFPMLSLLALYLIGAGAYQWVTGRGGIRRRVSALGRFAPHFAFAAIGSLLLVLHWVEG